MIGGQFFLFPVQKLLNSEENCWVEDEKFNVIGDVI